MAHLRSIEEPCQETDCAKKASVELYNHSNVRYGVFCGRHGRLRLKALQSDEDKRAAGGL